MSPVTIRVQSMDDYKSLRAAVMACMTLVNTQTHICWSVILLAQPTALKSDEENKHKKVSKSIKKLLLNAIIVIWGPIYKKS